MNRARLHARFKAAIIAATVGGIAAAALAATRTRPESPAARVATWRRAFATAPDRTRAALIALGMDPDHAVVSEANRFRVVGFSRDVCQADPIRGHRLRANTRSAWYELPPYRWIAGADVPAVAAAVAAAGGRRIGGSEQSTNSWGCRGPEPDPAARLRVLVIGDSFMQGILIGDRDTPPARLAAALGPGATVLNAGVYGYGPEQYLASIEEFTPRFQPHIVIIGLCCNDVDASDPGDVARRRDRLGRAAAYCAARGIACAVVAVPDFRRHPETDRDPAAYPECLRPGPESPAAWIDLGPALAAADPEITPATRKQSRLYLNRLRDGHLDAPGAEVWAREVARWISRSPLDRRESDSTAPAGQVPSPASRRAETSRTASPRPTRIPFGKARPGTRSPDEPAPPDRRHHSASR